MVPTQGPLNLLKSLLRCPKTDVSLENDDGKTALDLAQDNNRQSAIQAFGNRAQLTSQDGVSCP